MCRLTVGLRSPASHRRRARTASPRFRRRTSPRKATSSFGAQNFLNRQQDFNYTQTLQLAHSANGSASHENFVSGSRRFEDSGFIHLQELLLDPCRKSGNILRNVGNHSPRHGATSQKTPIIHSTAKRTSKGVGCGVVGLPGAAKSKWQQNGQINEKSDLLGTKFSNYWAMRLDTQ